MRPFRFGLIAREPGADGWADVAQQAESAGYATLLFPDHLGIAAPLVSVAAAAGATRRLRVGTLVVNNDFRHPAVLAQEIATADVLSGGRVELGLGAGHMRAEYEAIGLDFDDAPTRVARLEEAAANLRRLFAGETVTHTGDHYRIAAHRLEPRPPQGGWLPLLIGGNGTRLLSVAARQADIVQFTGFAPRKGGTQPTLTHFSAAGLADRLEVVRQAAGVRFDELELSVLMQMVLVTGDRQEAARRLIAERGWDAEPEVLLDSPFLLLGTAAEIAAQLRGYRERFGISYVCVFHGRSEGFDDVVAALTGSEQEYPTAMETIIRRARVEDAEAAAVAYVASAEHHHALDPDLYQVPDLETVTGRYRDRIPAADDNTELLVAQVDAQVVGTCLVRLLPAPSEASMLAPRTAAEVDVAVLPSHRGGGLGRALMEHAQRWAADRGAQRMLLNAHAANTSALAFYEQLGYHRVGLVLHKPLRA